MVLRTEGHRAAVLPTLISEIRTSAIIRDFLSCVSVIALDAIIGNVDMSAKVVNARVE
jgi:hypothetical protein